ncbi:hypothetical protein CYLTODRAFT_423350 [Cylindrobasidium torrendii FP15055 ss-10]|uniref:Uncharacterized protein n=1 Tax=Cylindrobasidium torrendii FP15055 ss-10 TaxID=1314674 RepID=A0A0D7B8I9_9AGAR|nr:hypothetical protein CYLTODRAFT_423350 [Cylindrobasidium torrendii FP15055 ss-10]
MAYAYGYQSQLSEGRDEDNGVADSDSDDERGDNGRRGKDEEEVVEESDVEDGRLRLGLHGVWSGEIPAHWNVGTCTQPEVHASRISESEEVVPESDVEDGRLRLGLHGVWYGQPSAHWDVGRFIPQPEQEDDVISVPESEEVEITLEEDSDGSEIIFYPDPPRMAGFKREHSSDDEDEMPPRPLKRGKKLTKRRNQRTTSQKRR